MTNSAAKPAPAPAPEITAAVETKEPEAQSERVGMETAARLLQQQKLRTVKGGIRSTTKEDLMPAKKIAVRLLLTSLLIGAIAGVVGIGVSRTLAATGQLSSVSG